MLQINKNEGNICFFFKGYPNFSNEDLCWGATISFFGSIREMLLVGLNLTTNVFRPTCISLSNVRRYDKFHFIIHKVLEIMTLLHKVCYFSLSFITFTFTINVIHPLVFSSCSPLIHDGTVYLWV